MWSAVLMTSVALLQFVHAAQGGLVRPERIVGGEPVLEGDALWQVSLQTKSGSPFCGGTLVKQDWVVTASHCAVVYTADAIRVVVGTNDLTRSDNEAYEVESIISHPQFNPDTMENDIAIVKLKMDGSRKASSGTPIPLDTKENRGTEDCRVTGFGRLSTGGATSDRMMSAVVPLVKFDACKEAFPSSLYTVGRGHICAGAKKTDACQGDSGGPLVCCNDPKLRAKSCTLVGVTSWGLRCATPGKPGIYTKVAHYRGWVNSAIKEHDKKRNV